MDILREALIKYNSDIQNNIEYFSITDDFDEDIIRQQLDKLNNTDAKIDSFLSFVNFNIDNNNMNLTIKQRNIYFKNYKLSNYDIEFIKTNMRTIKNKFYQRDSRYRKASAQLAQTGTVGDPIIIE